MTHKHYYSLILALIIGTNSFSMDRLEKNNFHRTLLVFSGVVIVTLVLLTKLKSWFANHSSVPATGGTIYTTTRSHIHVYDNQIIIEPNGSPQKLLDQLPLITPSGKNTTVELSHRIKCIQIPGDVAVVRIDTTQKPRIEKDEAFKDLIFVVENDVLTATTTDQKPRKFFYNKEKKPLCTIYAHLQTNKLVAEQHSRVHLLNHQKINTIVATTGSAVWGSIESTDRSLDLRATHRACVNIILKENSALTKTILCAENADIQLQGNQLGILKAKIHNSSNMYITGEAENPEIIADQQSTFNAPNPHFKQTKLTAKGDTLTAKSTNYSKIYVTGKVEDHIIVVSDSSIFDSSTMQADSASITIEKKSNVSLGLIKRKITRKNCDNSSSLKYTGNPELSLNE